MLLFRVFVTANDNGRLEFSEFCEIIAKNRKTTDQEEEELKNAFRLFDKNGEGTIDREQLKKVNYFFPIFLVLMSPTRWKGYAYKLYKHRCNIVKANLLSSRMIFLILLVLPLYLFLKDQSQSESLKCNGNRVSKTCQPIFCSRLSNINPFQ